MKQKSVHGDRIAFYRRDGKIIQLIGVLTNEEIELTNKDPSLLEEEQVNRINRVLEELKKDAERANSTILGQ